MRKTLIITIAAVLLLAAVICTAGCVETKTVDPAVGDWFADDDESLTVLSVYEDGTGEYLFVKAKVSETGESGSAEDEWSTFVWAKNADGTYLISFADGDKSTAEVNTQRGILTLDDGSVFEMKPSELSGDAPDLRGMAAAFIYILWLEEHPDATEEQKLAKINELMAQYPE